MDAIEIALKQLIKLSKEVSHDYQVLSQVKQAINGLENIKTLRLENVKSNLSINEICLKYGIDKNRLTAKIREVNSGKI